jgi:protein phosphatase
MQRTEPNLQQRPERSEPAPDAQSATFTIDAGGRTFVGQQRETNEDHFLVANIERSLRIVGTNLAVGLDDAPPQRLEGTLLVVADGIGGNPGGRVASEVAIRTVANRFLDALPMLEGLPEEGTHYPSLAGVRWRRQTALESGDSAVRGQGEAAGYPNMGTTLTAAYLSFPALYVAHAGDSRCYLLRRGKLYRMTHDHTLFEQMRERLGDAVSLNPGMQHILSNALGGGGKAGVRPELHRSELEQNDTLLLCSDGVTKHVDDETFAALLTEARSAERAASALVVEANDRGGSDNITAVVARVVPGRLRLHPHRCRKPAFRKGGLSCVSALGPRLLE